jgi:hypothetical protein
VDVNGAYAYVTNADVMTYASYFSVVDVGTPSSPVAVGQLTFLDGRSDGIAVSDGHGYVPAGPAGFRIIDVTDPADPVQVAAWNTAEVSRMAVSNSLAFALTSAPDESLRIVDVSDPLSPNEIGDHSPAVASGEPVTPWYVAVSDTRAYLALHSGDGVSGYVSYLQTIDASSPSHPVDTGAFVTSSGMSGYGVTVSSNLLYWARCEAGVDIYDVTACTHLVFTNGFESGDTWAWSNTVP